MKAKSAESLARMATVVWEIAQFLRDDWGSTEHFEPWPGLPSTPGTQPTLEQANFFFLGCCVDLQERYKVAWDKARVFFTETVPPEERPFLWRWISTHSEKEWAQHARDYKLHRFPAFHKRIHRIATSIQHQFGGDPREIWTPVNATRLLPILEEDLGVGPALSRMIIGALRDHRLIDLDKTDFKPDRHVCRLMQRLGLSQTSNPSDVLKAAKKYFPDPWQVDRALFYLGAELGITSTRGFVAFHQRMMAWKKLRPNVLRRLLAVSKVIHKDLGENHWTVDIESSLHWAGLYLVRTDGPLRDPMNTQDGSALWVWVGIGFYGELLSAIQLGGETQFLNSPVLLRKLKRLGFSPGEESRDPFSNQVSFWAQHSLSLQRVIPIKTFLTMFKHMASDARDLILTIEDTVS